MGSLTVTQQGNLPSRWMTSSIILVVGCDDVMWWFDSWEEELQIGLITKDMFLTKSISGGPRFTL